MHRALVRPELVWGCDRRLLYVLGTLAATLGGPAGVAVRNWSMTALGAAVFGFGVWGLQILAAVDPRWWDIRLRAREYSARYVARAAIDVPRKGPS